MGALTFGFMGSSSLTITNVAFWGPSGNANNYIILTIKNSGTKTVTIGSVKINGNLVTIDPLTGGSGNTTVLTYTTSGATATGFVQLDNIGWSNGSPYQFNLYDTSGNGIGSYQTNSPGS